MPRRRKRIAKVGPSTRRPGPRGRAPGTSGGSVVGVGAGLPGATKKLTNRPSSRSGAGRPTGTSGTKIPRAAKRGDEAVLGIDPGFGPNPVTSRPRSAPPRHTAPRPRPNAKPKPPRPMGRKPRA